MNDIGPLENCPSLAVIKFYRRLHNHTKARNSHFQYLLFGYFDGMKFIQKPSLESLFHNDQEQDDDGVSLSQIYEIQSLFLYSRRYTSDEVNRFFNDINKPPFLVITELKLNEKLLVHFYKENHKDPLKSFEDIILPQIENFKSEHQGEKLEYKIFMSLGYSELVLVFRTENYQIVSDIINRFRGATHPESATEHHILRFSYTTAGVSIPQISQLPDINTDVSLRFSFRVPVSLETMKEKLTKALNIKKGNVDYRTAFGKYDLELHATDVPIKDFMALYNDHGQKRPHPILDPKSELHKMIGHTNTHWLFTVTNNYENFPDDRIRSYHFPTKEVQLAEECITLEPLRTGFHQLMQSFYQILWDEASEPLLTYEFIDVIRFFSKQIREDHTRIVKLNNPTSRSMQQAKHNEALSIGIRTISQFLQSRIQAFRFFSEMPFYNLQYLRPATKVFVMYMAVIEEFERAFKNQTNSRSSHAHTITFFASLDYLDKVKSFDLFPETEHRVIPIIMSYSSFFNIPYNILLLVHEIAHYIQSPNRVNRNETITKMICNRITEDIYYRVITGEDNLWVDNLDKADEHLTLRLHERLRTFFFHQLWRKGTQIKKNISIRAFPGLLWSQIQEEFLLDNKDVRKAFKECSEYLEVLSAQYEENESLPKLHHILEKTMEKIASYDDISLLKDLWTALVEADDIKNSIQPDQREALKKKWKKIIGQFDRREKALLTTAEKLINAKWFVIMEKLVSGLEDTPNIPMLSYLAKRHVIEDTPENREYIAKEIIKFMNSAEPKLELQRYIYTLSQLLLEARADYIMCKLLNLRWEHYEWLIDRYKERVDPEARDEGLTELDYRKAILSRTNLFQDKEKIIIDPETDEEIDGMLIDDFIEILNFIDDEILEQWGNGACIKHLQEFYAGFTPGKPGSESDDLNHIHLVEQLWHEGINLVLSDGEPSHD